MENLEFRRILSRKYSRDIMRSLTLTGGLAAGRGAAGRNTTPRNDQGTPVGSSRRASPVCDDLIGTVHGPPAPDAPLQRARTPGLISGWRRHISSNTPTARMPGAAFSIISDMLDTGTATRGAHPHPSRRPARREREIRYPQNYAMSQSCFTHSKRTERRGLPQHPRCPA